MSGKTLTYNKLINQHLEILKGLQYKTGLFAASSKKVDTGYDKSWIRDNFYECLAFEVINDWDTVEKTYNALLGIFLKHEQKIDWAIKNKPQSRHEYIHARYNPETFGEFWEEWGNKQNDSIGAVLFKIGQLVHVYKRNILKNDDHLRIVQKLIWYLNSIEYWHDKDSGMWEEDEEIHASSVGACVAGLKMIGKVEGIEIPGDLIQNGEVTLNSLLPRESNRKFVDVALLSLIYPYDVVSAEQRKQILTNVEYHLLKERGVIRYKNDYYYNKNVDQYSEEAEWTFGLSWLAIIYEELGDFEKAKSFINQIIPLDTDEGIPELYYSNSPEHNENNPLGWSESLFIISLYEMNKKHYSHLNA